MVNYKCFKCGKKTKVEDLNKRFVCTSCGSLVFFKPQTKLRTVKTD